MNKIELKNLNESSFTHGLVLSSVLDTAGKSFVVDSHYALLDSGENDWCEMYVIEHQNNIDTKNLENWLLI